MEDTSVEVKKIYSDVIGSLPKEVLVDVFLTKNIYSTLNLIEEGDRESKIKELSNSIGSIKSNLENLDSLQDSLQDLLQAQSVLLDTLKLCKAIGCKVPKDILPVDYYYFDVMKLDPEDIFGLGKPGDIVTIRAYYEDKNKRIIVGSTQFEIVKTGYEYMQLDNFGLTPLVNIEFGKETGNGETESGTSLGFGLSYLFFYKSARHPRLSNLGLGLNLSYANTKLLNSDTQNMETTNVMTAGGTIAFRLDPFLFTFVIGVNVTGDDKYCQLAFGLGKLLN